MQFLVEEAVILFSLLPLPPPFPLPPIQAGDLRYTHKKRMKRRATENRESKRGHRNWTKEKDKVLVESLHVLKHNSHWRGDNGTFRIRYLTQLEKMLESKLPHHT